MELYEQPTGEILDEVTIAELSERHRKMLANELAARGVLLSDIEAGIQAHGTTN